VSFGALIDRNRAIFDDVKDPHCRLMNVSRHYGQMLPHFVVGKPASVVSRSGSLCESTSSSRSAQAFATAARTLQDHVVLVADVVRNT